MSQSIIILKNVLVRATAIVIFAMLSSCVGMPDNIQPVKNFDASRYLGTWYEIARLNHSFEKDLQQVTAQYSLRKDGGISVLNKGFNSKEKEWKIAEGKAFFVQDITTGYLKVSFFGPFYSSYIIFELDENYQYAFVTGFDHKNLWLLSRTPQVSEELMQHFLEVAKSKGFSTRKLIYVDQNLQDSKQ